MVVHPFIKVNVHEDPHLQVDVPGLLVLLICYFPKLKHGFLV